MVQYDDLEATLEFSMSPCQARKNADGALDVRQVSTTSRPLVLPVRGFFTLDEGIERVARKINLARLIDDEEGRHRIGRPAC
jgi:hypothetical protein